MLKMLNLTLKKRMQSVERRMGRKRMSKLPIVAMLITDKAETRAEIIRGKKEHCFIMRMELTYQIQ